MSGKNKDTFKRALLSCDKLASGYTAALLFFFMPYCIRTVGGYMLWILPAVCFVPFAIMPLIYTMLHRFSPLLFGRYHLFMPITGVLSALFTVLVWSVGDGSPLSVCVLFFGALLFSLCVLTYRYCAFSVRVRLIGDDVARPPFIGNLFAFLGMGAAFGAAYGFYSRPAGVMTLDVAFTLGSIGIVGAVIQYLASYTEIPKLAVKRQMTAKDGYRELYTGLNKRYFLSSMLLLAAVGAVISHLAYFAFSAGLEADMIFAAIGTAIGALALAVALFTRTISSRSTSTTLSLVFLLLSAAAVHVAVYVDGSALICVFACAALAGISGAAALRRTRLCFVSIKRGVTGGTAFIMLGLVLLAAAGLACFACAATALTVDKLGIRGFQTGMFAAEGAAVLAVILYFSGVKSRREKTA